MNFHLMLGEKKMKNSFKTIFSAPLALIVNLLLIYVSFSLCRLLFIWVNHNYFTDLTFSHFWEMFRGGLVFDTSAILYTNALYILFCSFSASGRGFLLRMLSILFRESSTSI